MTGLHESDAFNNAAYQAALQFIYPKWFAGEINVKDCANSDLDHNQGVDVVVWTWHKFGPSRVTVAERFRRPDPRYPLKDFTISDSEWRKITAQFYVYGTYDEDWGTIPQCVLINIARMWQGIHSGVINVGFETNRKNDLKGRSGVQPFATVSLLEAEYVGAIEEYVGPRSWGPR